jgi:tRNA/tmRNA/rRNA uracil-C5-methylase (TrmA/RlmC/RlmD family)
VRGWPFDPAGATVIVDPPRTGMSREALDGVLGMRPPRLVYVSCDVATLARDVKALATSGFAVASLEGFDLFPNTAHVETLAVLARR